MFTFNPDEPEAPPVVATSDATAYPVPPADNVAVATPFKSASATNGVIKGLPAS